METVVDDLGQAWGTAFLPDSSDLLVAQVAGALSLVDTENGETTEIDGTPEVTTEGQGGLLDVAVDPGYPEEPWIYLTYSAEDGEGTASTHVGRGQLDVGEATLQGFEDLFTGEPGTSTEHFGSVLAFDADGKLVVTFGGRGSKEFDDHPAQDTSNTLGTTVRLERDGSVPEDDPFVDDEVDDEIVTYGHRNVQGIAVQPATDRIWLSEHGEREGDALRTIEGGQNHGRPVAHTGCEYGTDAPLATPRSSATAWRPRCTTGSAARTGSRRPAWLSTRARSSRPGGDLLMAGLGQQDLARFSVDGTGVEEAEELLVDEALRVRDVAVGPQNGTVYVVFDDEGAPRVKLTAEG